MAGRPSIGPALLLKDQASDLRSSGGTGLLRKSDSAPMHRLSVPEFGGYLWLREGAATIEDAVVAWEAFKEPSWSNLGCDRDPKYEGVRPGQMCGVDRERFAEAFRQLPPAAQVEILEATRLVTTEQIEEAQDHAWQELSEPRRKPKRTWIEGVGEVYVLSLPRDRNGRPIDSRDVQRLAVQRLDREIRSAARPVDVAVEARAAPRTAASRPRSRRSQRTGAGHTSGADPPPAPAPETSRCRFACRVIPPVNAMRGTDSLNPHPRRRRHFFHRAVLVSHHAAGAVSPRGGGR